MTEQVVFERWDIARSPSPDGLNELTVLSPALGRRADLTVFAPPGHEDAAGLPVVILLHGVFGSHWAWARSGFAHVTLSELVAEGRIAPFVLAMPSDGLFGVGGGYIRRNGEDAERWIRDEVAEAVKLVHPHVNTEDVSLAGLSMGGWGALRLAGRHPHRFRAAVGMSPLTRLEHVAGYAPARMRAAHAPANAADPELADLLIRRAIELPPIRITCGLEDELIEEVRLLHHGLRSAGVRHEYEEGSGGHTWEYWTEELRTALLFIDESRKRPLSSVPTPDHSTAPQRDAAR